MSDLSQEEKAFLMNEALGFFFVDIEGSCFFDFDSNKVFFEVLTVDELKKNLGRLQVSEAFEHWDIDILCGNVACLYDVLISVYCRAK